MRKIGLILILLVLFFQKGRAQSYVSINFDGETIAALGILFQTQLAEEDSIQAALEHNYDAAIKQLESSTVIMGSKYMDRQSRTKIQQLANATENYLYMRVRQLLLDRILPLTLEVGQECLRHPDRALYWGPYLSRICTDTQNACQQFESIVTNSQLSFSDISFYNVTEDFKNLVNLINRIGDDFVNIVNDFANEGIDTFSSKEKLKEKLLNGIHIEISPGNGITVDHDFMPTELINKATELKTLIKGVYDMTQVGIEDMVKDYFSNGGHLFVVSDYSMDNYNTDYAGEAQYLYYTQTWSIVRYKTGGSMTETRDVTSSHSPAAVYHYFCDNTYNTYTTPPSQSQIEAELDNNVNSTLRMLQSNYPEAKVSLRDSYWEETISATQEIACQKHSGSHKDVIKEMSIIFHVLVDIEQQNVATSEIVESQVLNTQKTSEVAFSDYMYSLLSSYQSDPRLAAEGWQFRIEKGEKVPLEANNPGSSDGIHKATIKRSCDLEKMVYGPDNFIFKCWDCRRDFSSHETNEAMGQYTGDGNSDYATIVNKIIALESEIEKLYTQKATLQARISQQETYIANYGERDDYYNLQLAALENLRDQLSQLENQILQKEKDLADAEAARDAIESEMPSPGDHPDDLNSVMRDLTTQFSLTWQGVGSWTTGHDHAYYKRTATTPLYPEAVLYFDAELSITQYADWTFGVQVHRQYTKCEYKLYVKGYETETLEEIDFPDDMDAAQKADIVNRKVQNYQNEYPGCTITVDYLDSDEQTGDDTEDTYHLLYVSDRIAIAQQIEKRLLHIGSELAVVSRLLKTKASITDKFIEYLPQIDYFQGKNRTAFDRKREEWLERARNVRPVSHH